MEKKESLVFKVMMGFIKSLVVSFIGMIVGVLFIPPAAAMVIGIIMVVFLFITLIYKAVSRRRKESSRPTYYNLSLSMTFVYVFTFFMGISVYPNIAYHISSMGANLVLGGIAITVVLFTGICIYAVNTKRDFSYLGMFLLIALIALVILGIVSIFVHIPMFSLMVTWLGILIFSGYVLFDMNKVNNAYFTEEDVPALVLDLYLDFLNLLLYVLDLLEFIDG